MATDTHETHPTEQKSGAAGCLKGCLIVFFVLLILGALGVWWVVRNARDWASSGVSMVLTEMIEQSELPADEQAELKEEAKRLTDAIADGRISVEQGMEMMMELEASPLLPLIVIKSVEMQYLKPSGLSEEEKTEGMANLERYAHGLASKQIPQESTDKVLQHIGTKDEEGNYEFKEKVTDEELRAFLAAAKDEADQAEVPEEVPPIDPSEELKKIVDKVLGPSDEAAPEPPMDEPASEPAAPAANKEAA